MKIEKVEISRLRAFESVEVLFDDYICLVGPNGAGKSTVLCALNIFFRQTEHTGTNLQNLDKEDFFKGDTSKPISIRVTFCDLEPEAVEAFAHYARADKLIVTAEAAFDSATGKATVTHYGERMAMPEFAPFFERRAAGAPAVEINAMYEEYRKRFPDLSGSARSMDAKLDELRTYERDRPEQCQPLRSKDEFYGVSKGANRLERFVQWVYVPAVKDALEEQAEAKTGALGKLLARAVGARSEFQARLEALKAATREKYQELLDEHQGALDKVSAALNERLAEWAHHGATLKLEWQEDRDRSVRIEEPWAHVKVGEGAFEGRLARLGHGLQRSYIIALLQELALYDRQDGPTLLLAIEEPELYQHPPQARHLAGVLEQLASDAQVMVSTHSPFFVSGSVFENVRVVRRPAKDVSSTVRWASAKTVGQRIGDALGEPYIAPSATIARLQQILQPQLAEMFFATRIVLLEGREDLAFIQTYLQLAGQWDEFRKNGCHFVAVDGKSELLRPLVVTQVTDIPCFVVFDADGDVNKPEWKVKHERDNRSLLKALGGAADAPFPHEVLLSDTYCVWPNCLRGSLKSSLSEDVWTKCQNAANLDFENPGGLNKNVMQIGRFVEKLWAEGVKPEPLKQLAERLLAFARS